MDPLLILHPDLIEADSSTEIRKSLEVVDELMSKAEGGKKSDDWISNKISYLVKEEGKPQDQAIAIAYSMAGRSRKDVKKSLTEPRLVLAL
jgi:hypothetical protein